MASAVTEVTWLLGLFKDLGVTIHAHIPVLSDSKSAIQLAPLPSSNERTKYIEIDCHFIRDKVKTGWSRLSFAVDELASSSYSSLILDYFGNMNQFLVKKCLEWRIDSRHNQNAVSANHLAGNLIAFMYAIIV
ncbi:PREDICTED: uncharacterized protein LOC109230365 [Nicotiana attenuata]|uniref:uncharacterized protein LOC109230365 n=1 Tax=Nicotiana attenuata TaxID=49451 RepID=UPI0009049CE9|nr:PREDICTED: uncharacterized protein LOC109230365 [Nicotiana attenuata]